MWGCVYQDFKNEMGYSKRTEYKYLYSIKIYFQIVMKGDWSGRKVTAYLQFLRIIIVLQYKCSQW
jgi:hypothetical protein